MLNELLQEYTGSLFPRGLGNPYRKNNFGEYYIANSIEDIEEFIKLNNEINCYCTVYAYKNFTQNIQDKSSAIIDVIPFDFDSDDLEESYKDLKILLSWCKRHNISPRIQFSGSKGFHALIDIEPITLRNPQRVLARFGHEINKAAKFTTLDLCLFGDLSRIIRIPNTINRKTGRYCIPLNINILPFLKMEDIIKMSESKSNYIPIRQPAADEIHTLLHEYDDLVEKEMEERKKELEKLSEIKNNGAFKGLSMGTPCLAYHNCVAKGCPKGSYNFYISGITQKLKSDGYTKAYILQKLLEVGKICNPPMDESVVRRTLDYQWTKNWSFCTFFSKVDNNCITCPNRSW